MADILYRKVKGPNRLLWIARICLFASAISILIVTYFFYAPYAYMHPFSSPQIGQIVWRGGILLAIAGFAWRWPGPSGIVAIIYVCYELFVGITRYGWDPTHPPLLIPLAVYSALYGTFLAGGILHLIVGLRQKIVFLYPESQADKQIRRAAHITSVATIATFAVIYSVIYLQWWVFGCIPALIFVASAWKWPAPGGILMLLLSVPGYYMLYDSNADFQTKLPAYILGIIFMLGGVLYLVTGWRQRKRR